MEVAQGVSIAVLKGRLLGAEVVEEDTNGASSTESGNGHASPEGGDKDELPKDLIGIQAYIRWEKAGKPNYSTEEQLVTIFNSKS